MKIFNYETPSEQYYKFAFISLMQHTFNNKIIGFLLRTASNKTGNLPLLYQHDTSMKF